MLDFRYTVTKKDQEEKTPVKDILRREFGFSARMRKRIKREKLIKVNGADTPGWVSAKEGDLITVSIPDEESNFPPEDIPLDVLFEDENLLIINKVPGIIVHPTNGNPNGTVANGVAKYYLDTGQSYKIRFINRLDMDTSGILMIAKNGYTQSHMMSQMKEGSIQKDYLSVVEGIVERDAGIINEPMGLPEEGGIKRMVLPENRGGYPSLTRYSVLERFHEDTTASSLSNSTGPANDRTLVRLSLETGRTHQIRVHMAYLGHPVLSDPLYGHMFPEEIPRQALHASFSAFTHPVTGLYTEVRAPLPGDMTLLLQRLRRG